MVKLSLNIDRKQRYLVQSILSFVYIYFVLFKLSIPVTYEITLVTLFVVIASIISHYPNVRLNNLLFSIILPWQLMIAAVLFLKFFPNLGFLFRLCVVIGTSFLYYVISLVDNIFFVVQDREEQIPLYRVAVTWAQILSIMVAIPLFSSLFKLNINAFWQGAVVSISALLFCIYQFWEAGFDKDLKRPKVGEYVLLNLLVMFMIFVGSVSVSFFPTEAFLRGSYTSIILMFGLTYVYGHLKNDIDEKIMFQYLFLIFGFFFILLIFMP